MLIEMAKFTTTTTVKAFKIGSISSKETDNGQALNNKIVYFINPAEEGMTKVSIKVSNSLFKKYQPVVGDYYCISEEGIYFCAENDFHKKHKEVSDDAEHEHEHQDEGLEHNEDSEDF